MSTSTNMRVSDQERNAAITAIQAAYAEGRLDEPNLERRLDLALNARTRLELNQSLEGLVRFRPQTPFTAPTMPLVRAGLAGTALQRSHADGPVAGLTHLSALPFGPFGPGAVWLFAGQGTAVRREAAKALNFQVIAWVIGAVLGIAAGIFNLGFLAGIWGVSWFVLTIVSGVKAWKGEDWENPVTTIVDKRLVDEGRGHR
ncbi:DUF1707 and DUF4870 domain-containing protein [Tessaracoccus rhinocerotis]|uniref:DUF1707 and DUF4870 domain-containing protein n=1 Tax=Tessaracoccus rhinocerotis TaxID=1689449 RepID=A0A553K421_9ACTN|nr:DUF1707 and DUF4870 domain-containing protein [Tessaracoccus rhinocerotis]TRY19463.1 DUF1707 and DUF4870 domain-containing protein [Tessaracoccus rhinocerotis]